MLGVSCVKMSRVCGVLFCALLCHVLSAAVAEENEVERGIQMLYKTYHHCEASGDLVPCLKIKAVKFAERALKINNIPLFEGLTVVRNEEADARAFSGIVELDENSLPENAEAKEEALDDMLVDRVTRFFRTHSVQFGLPRLTDGPDGNTEEGRGKYKKYMGPLMMAAMMKGGLFAYATKMVGLLAAKAFMVSKIALILASVVAVKKLFSSGGAESKTIEIVQKPQISHSHAYSGDFNGIGSGQGWEASGSGGGGYGRRSFDTSIPYPAAQDLAYRGRAKQ